MAQGEELPATGDEVAPPAEFSGQAVSIVVGSMAGNEVLRCSLDSSVTFAHICAQVAGAVGVRDRRVGVLHGMSLCDRQSTLGVHLGDGLAEDATLELTYVLNRACVFSLESFIGTGIGSSMSRYEWTADYDPLDALTIMCWVKTRSAGHHCLVSRGEWCEGYSLAVLARTHRHETVQGWCGEELSGRKPFDPDTWYHVALVFDGTALQVYHDGELARTRACQLSDNQYTKNDLWIGGEALGLGMTHEELSPRNFLDGELRHFGIYAEALSGEDIQSEFSQGVSDLQ